MEKSRTVKRKLFCMAAGWLSGIAVCALMPWKYVIIAAAGIFFPAAAFALFKKPYRPKLAAAAIISAGMILSAARVGWYESRVAAPLKDCSGSEIVMRGIVTDRSESCLTVRGELQNNGVKTSVTFERTGKDISPGDEVLVRGEVRTPQSTLTFDKEDYNISLGVFLEGEGEARFKLLQKRRDPFLAAVNSVRSRSVENIRRRLPGQEGAFLTAILCSDKTALTAVTRSAVYRAGLGHLFAVSGTHVVILCSFIGMLLDLVKFPAKSRSLLMLLLIVSFAVFSGCSPSVVRACIMMSLCEMGGLFNRQTDSPTSLGLAAILITARCPYTLWSMSFMLSFTAAFAIGTIAPAICRRRIQGKTARSAVAVMSVNVMTAPICVTAFSEVSLISAASNLLMIPLCSACLSLCFLYLLTGCTVTPLLAAAGLAARVILKICGVITASRLSFAGTYFREQLLTVALIAAAMFIICAVTRKRREDVIFTCVTAYIFMICSFFICDRLPKTDRLTVYPSEYGCTAVIERGDEVLIFDSGGFYTNAYAASRLAECRHPQRTYICTLKSRPKVYERYGRELAGAIRCYPGSPACAGFTRFEGGELIVTVDSGRLVLGRDSLTIDGRSYEYSGFTDISVFYLR